MSEKNREKETLLAMFTACKAMTASHLAKHQQTCLTTVLRVQRMLRQQTCLVHSLTRLLNYIHATGVAFQNWCTSFTCLLGAGFTSFTCLSGAALQNTEQGKSARLTQQQSGERERERVRLRRRRMGVGERVRV
jgi:hypothetical protein